MNNSTVFCKDCQHAKVSWHAYLVSFGKPDKYDYKCTAHPIENEENLITGIHPPTRYYSCTSARDSQAKCGEEGRHWKPKELTKSNLLKVLSRPG